MGVCTTGLTSSGGSNIQDNHFLLTLIEIVVAIKQLSKRSPHSTQANKQHVANKQHMMRALGHVAISQATHLRRTR